MVTGKQLRVLQDCALKGFSVYDQVRSDLLSGEQKLASVAEPYVRLLRDAHLQLLRAKGTPQSAVVLNYVEESVATAGLGPFILACRRGVFKTATGAATRLVFRLQNPLWKFIRNEFGPVGLRKEIAATPAVDNDACAQRIIEEYSTAVRRLNTLRNSQSVSLASHDLEDLIPAQGLTPGSLAELLQISPSSVARWADKAGIVRPKSGQKSKPYPLIDVRKLLQTVISRSPRDTKRAVFLLDCVASRLALSLSQD